MDPMENNSHCVNAIISVGSTSFARSVARRYEAVISRLAVRIYSITPTDYRFNTASNTASSDKKFHVEHFTCSVCPTVFGPQDSYYEHENDVYCHFHYSTRFATKCAGCNSAILKQFVEINRNNRDECWHPECYMINKVCQVLNLVSVDKSDKMSCAVLERENQFAKTFKL